MEQKLNVALVIDSFYPSIDGVIKVVESYILGLSDKCNITLITSRPKNESDIKKYYSKLPCRVLFCNSSKNSVQQQYTVAKPNFDFEFKKQLADAKFNLIHLHSLFPLGIFMYKFAIENNIPLVATAHSQLAPDIKRYAKFDVLTNLVFKNFINMYNNMACVFSLNKKMENYLHENGFKGKSIVMPNATSFKLTKPLSECRENGQKLLQVKNGENVFLFVGRLIEDKGILLIVEALNILKQKGISFKMFFVGDGPDKNKLKQAIKQHKLESQIKLLGMVKSQNKLQNIYAVSTLFLFPSSYDTDGLVKREAACCYVPSVLLKDSFASSEIKNGLNGYLCENSPESLAATIIKAISNKQKLKQVGNNAKKSLYFTWNKNLNEVYNQYIKLVQNNNKKVK